MNHRKQVLRLAIPSDGALHESTLMFLRSCGLGVLRPNSRRYTAAIPALDGVTVLFQRGSDITSKVEEGSADMGIVGHDRYLDSRREGGDAIIVIDTLGYGNSRLVLGVPDSWVDVSSLADLAELSVEMREEGRDIRVATKYPRLVERFLLGNGVNYFTLVQSSGTLEAAPTMGFADVIADITESGVTMRENHLKNVHGGTIMTSSACLIGNKALLAADPDKLRLARAMAELMEGRLQSQEFYSVTANMRGENPEEIACYVFKSAEISGLRGPTIAKVYTPDGQDWYAVTVVVQKDKLLDAVAHLRRVGGSVTVSQPSYVFGSACEAHARLG